jgi:rod shape-determining protein MreC
MTYTLDKQRRNKKLRNTFLIIFILFLIFYFNKPIAKVLGTFTHTVLRPVLVFGNNASTRLHNLGSYFASKNTLLKENDTLKEEKLSLESKLVNYQSIENENKSLKELLGRLGENNSYILATILAKPNVTLFDTLLLDVGELDKVSVGDIVFAYGNIPLGKISEVYSHTSKVTLFSNAGEKTNAIISSTNTYIDLIGRGGGNFEIILPRDFTVSEGENILLPDLNNYLIAKVVSTISDARDSYQKALLISPVNIQQLKFVQIRK